jgi:hypothetical protein
MDGQYNHPAQQIPGAAGAAGPAASAIPAPPFLDTVIERLGNIRENLKRATHNLADAGFYSDPAAVKQPATDQPDTKRVIILDMLHELEQAAIELVQQVNKVA